MKCHKHLIEYGFGNCPICTQEAHNKEMQRLTELQANSLKDLEQDVNYRSWQEKFDREIAAATKEEERKEAITSFHLGLWEATFGGTSFIAQHYLRLVTGNNLAKDYINKIISKMSEDDRELVEIQINLLNALKLKKNQIEEHFGKKKNEIEQSGAAQAARILPSLLLGLYAFYFGWNFSGLHGFLAVIINSILGLIFGAIGFGIPYFIIEAITRKSADSKIDELESTKSKMLTKIEESCKWYSEEKSASETLWSSLGEINKYGTIEIATWLANETPIDREILPDLAASDIKALQEFRF